MKTTTAVQQMVSIVKLFLLAALLAFVSTSTNAQSILHTLTDPGRYFGMHQGVGGAGDVNGDGVPDIIVGATEEAGAMGFAKVFSGADATLLHHFVGPAANSWFGYSVAGARDVNLDGFDDVIVGTVHEDHNGVLAVGSATVFSGATGAVLYKVFGDDAYDGLGGDVAGVGDVNADGYPDFAASMAGDDNNGTGSGSIRVFSGRTGLPLYTFSGDAHGDLLGASVRGAGDVNNDGYDDIIAGAYGGAGNPIGTTTGYARVYSGRDGSTLYTVFGDSPDDFFGYSVCGVGDLNGDGFVDFAVSAPQHDGGHGYVGRGYVRVFSGSNGSVLFSLTGNAVGDRFGNAIAGPGDVNGDGVNDLLIGAPGALENISFGTGKAYVFSGANQSLIASFGGVPFSNTQRGISVAATGDVNGDGLNDMVIGGDGHVIVIAVNSPPHITSVAGPTLVAIGAVATVSVNFTDSDATQQHACNFSWGDGSPGASELAPGTGSGSCAASHLYSLPGVYAVTVSVTDSLGATATDVYQFIVVYDPTGGFVTGGGWVNSPPGAYAINPSLTGKANFGFVSKYQTGATAPTGNTEFQFKAGDLNFKSTSYEWLVVAGAKAKFKGSGLINGSGDYAFQLTATDGQVNGGGGTDRFRIKIWDKSDGGVIYDNQPGDLDTADATTALGGGSIVVHKP